MEIKLSNIAKLLGAFGFVFYENNKIDVTNYEIKSKKIKNDVKIVQLSDLHGKQFGAYNNRLLKKVDKINPDFIVYTGDLIDKRRGDNMDETFIFLNKLVSKYEVFYIRGNHEKSSPKRQEIFARLMSIKSPSFHFLQNKSETVKVNGTTIAIMGADDSESRRFKKFEQEDCFKIVLNHFPNFFDEEAEFCETDIDMQFAGHAHGGQWISPFFGGLFAPDQGILPRFYRGMHEHNGKKLVVSRGMGNSLFPFRLFNRPEIVVVTLKKARKKRHKS